MKNSEENMYVDIMGLKELTLTYRLECHVRNIAVHLFLVMRT